MPGETGQARQVGVRLAGGRAAEQPQQRRGRPAHAAAQHQRRRGLQVPATKQSKDPLHYDLRDDCL